MTDDQEYERIKARFVASEYHGGQFTPLYAFASSGKVTPYLWADARDAAVYADEIGQEYDAKALRWLADYAYEREEEAGE